MRTSSKRRTASQLRQYRLLAIVRETLGQASMVEVEGFEDFAEFNLSGISSLDLWVGAVSHLEGDSRDESRGDIPSAEDDLQLESWPTWPIFRLKSSAREGGLVG